LKITSERLRELRQRFVLEDYRELLEALESDGKVEVAPEKKSKD
jgi:hypothetical protein